MVKTYCLFAVIPALIFIDQLSKWAVTELLLRPASGGNSYGFIDWALDAPMPLSFSSIEITSFFNLVMVWNKGVSFGMFQASEQMGVWLLSGFAVIVSIGFFIWMLRSHSKLQKWALALVIAGAIGNVIDRLRFGGVIDFLDFHAFGWHYPAFNIADSLIVIGVIMLLFHNLFLEKTP